jgi:hypothetical protein
MTETIDNTEHTTLEDFCPKDKFSTHPDNPLKKSEFDWLFKCRADNGFAKAFVRVNAKKYLVHIPSFVKCLADRRGV